MVVLSREPATGNDEALHLQGLFYAGWRWHGRALPGHAMKSRETRPQAI